MSVNLYKPDFQVAYADPYSFGLQRAPSKDRRVPGSGTLGTREENIRERSEKLERADIDPVRSSSMERVQERRRPTVQLEDRRRVAARRLRLSFLYWGLGHVPALDPPRVHERGRRRCGQLGRRYSAARGMKMTHRRPLRRTSIRTRSIGRRNLSAAPRSGARPGGRSSRQLLRASTRPARTERHVQVSDGNTSERFDCKSTTAAASPVGPRRCSHLT